MEDSTATRGAGSSKLHGFLHLGWVLHRQSSLFPGAGHQEDDSTDYRRYADDRRDGDGMLAFGLGVDGTNVQDRFLLGVGDALVG